MASILTLTGAAGSLGRESTPEKPRNADRPTTDLKVGQCMCILNNRTKKGVSVCRVPPGETRSGSQVQGQLP